MVSVWGGGPLALHRVHHDSPRRTKQKVVTDFATVSKGTSVAVKPRAVLKQALFSQAVSDKNPTPEDPVQVEVLKQALEAYPVPVDLSWVWEERGPAGTTLEASWTDIVHSHSTMSKIQRHQQEALWEFVHTELTYINKLVIINDVTPTLLFSNLPLVLNAHRQFWQEVIYPMLQEVRTTGTPFDPRSLEAGCLQWVETHPQCGRMRLGDMQAKPHQRITKYPLLLKAVLKNTLDPHIQQTIRGMHVREICHFDLMRPVVGVGPRVVRKLLLQENLKMRGRKDSKLEVVALLFSDVLLMTKVQKKVERLKSGFYEEVIDSETSQCLRCSKCQPGSRQSENCPKPLHVAPVVGIGLCVLVVMLLAVGLITYTATKRHTKSKLVAKREASEAPKATPKEEDKMLIHIPGLIYSVLDLVPATRVKELARGLGVMDVEIERVGLDHRICKEAHYQMLRVWAERETRGGGVLHRPLIQRRTKQKVVTDFATVSKGTSVAVKPRAVLKQALFSQAVSDKNPTPEDPVQVEVLKQALEAYPVPVDLSWVWEERGPAGTTLEASWTDIVHSHSTMSKIQRHQQEALWEFVHTELTYINKLVIINDVTPTLLFSNLPLVLNAHRQFWQEVIYPMLQEVRTTGTPFDPRSLEAGCLQWVETHPQCGRMRLGDMQAKPHQRITKYPLLLKAVLKNTLDPHIQQTIRGMVRISPTSHTGGGGTVPLPASKGTN
ncbi:hypothetical protein CRUP_027860 [Coryphaenoides rupestris]|nr:hypothetical protein CRUP_027860 [Coryphaenoides rupestris]